MNERGRGEIRRGERQEREVEREGEEEGERLDISRKDQPPLGPFS